MNEVVNSCGEELWLAVPVPGCTVCGCSKVWGVGPGELG